ncbi:TPA: fimbria/pilus periplasmic chaperone [Citrobacter koseri]|nr:fimbria/pilus periplasmic chaperone [Citrobacter koseri]
MHSLFSIKYSHIILIVTSFLCTTQVYASGIVLGGTRVIYPIENKQVSISVRNTSEKSRFMVQSWAEDTQGKKTDDFVVTPPIYVSNPGQENALRIMYSGSPLRKDRETLYFLNTKAIPALDKSKLEGRNVLMLATSTRIKMFMRPSGLTPEVNKAPDMLTFKKHGQQVRVENPTPYYITLVNIKAGNHKLGNTMIPPRDSKTLALTSSDIKSVSFQTVNDYGGYTKVQSVPLN